jgi:hypothetical protein
MPIVATELSYRDQDHRCSVQSLLSGQLPRADRHHLGLRRRIDAILPDGRAAARRVDETASGRALGGMALRDRQTGRQGGLGWNAARMKQGRRFPLNGSRMIKIDSGARSILLSMPSLGARPS